eukprot:7816-Heterococcus_DN1.PRE.3
MAQLCDNGCNDVTLSADALAQCSAVHALLEAEAPEAGDVLYVSSTRVLVNAVYAVVVLLSDGVLRQCTSLYTLLQNMLQCRARRASTTYLPFSKHHYSLPSTHQCCDDSVIPQAYCAMTGALSSPVTALCLFALR